MLAGKEKILLYGGSIWYLGEGMLGPLFAVFAERIGGNILDITWAWATYLIVSGVLIFFVGKISDEKFTKDKLMMVGYGLNAVFTFGYLLISTPTHLFLVQAGLGVAAAFATPTWHALYAKYEDKRHVGSTWGLADGSAELITGVAIIFGGLIVTYFSFTALFLIMGIVQVIATIYQGKILRK